VFLFQKSAFYNNSTDLLVFLHLQFLIASLQHIGSVYMEGLVTFHLLETAMHYE